ncbi:MAG: DUF4838 domain-containing protein [Candidatus Sumerlaeaceae bacterium]
MKLYPSMVVCVLSGQLLSARGETTASCCLAPEYSFYGGAKQCVRCESGRDAGTSQPLLKYRKLYVEEGHSHRIENLKQMVEWMPKVGYNVLVVPTNYQGSGRVRWDNWREALTPELKKRGILIEVGGHGYQNFLGAKMEDGKLFEQHPDWFGANKQGERQRQEKWAFCTSNAAAVDYFTSNVLAYLRDRPEIDIFDCWPPDGAKWCECDACAKLGSPSNRQAILINGLAAKLREQLPKMRLEVLAYHTSVMPPESVKLDSSVLLDFCPISQCFEVQINDSVSTQNLAYVEGLKAWRAKFDGDISVYTYYRKYAWDSLPAVFPHYIQKDVQFYRTIPVQGISIYSEPADWGTYELNHYSLAKLAENPDADVDAIVRDFCNARYGAAAEVAQRVYGTLEEIVPRYCSLPGTTLKSADEQRKAEQRLRDAQQELKSAAMTNAGDAATSAALNRLNLVLEYVARDVELRRLRASGASREELLARLQDLRNFLSAHSADGVFLISENRLSEARMTRKYVSAPKGGE